MSGQLHDFATILPGTKPQYQLNRRLDRLQSYKGCFGETRKISCPVRKYTAHHPAHSLVAKLTTLEVLDDAEYW